MHTNTTPDSTTSDEAALAAELQESIAAQVQQFRKSDRWTAFCDFVASFRSYSLGNTLLVMSQRPYATRVAGPRQWLDHGRTVRPDEIEYPIYIYGHSLRSFKITDDETGETQTRKAHRFPVIKVYDISQTDPIDGVPQHDTPTTTIHGDDHAGILTRVTGHLAATGWTLTRRHIAQHSCNGYTDPDTREVVIAADIPDAQAAKTALHELAHIVLGHTDNYGEYRAHRGVMETEAESTAYIVAALNGLDTSDYSIAYIATWAPAASDRLIKRTAKRVLKAVKTISNDLAIPH